MIPSRGLLPGERRAIEALARAFGDLSRLESLERERQEAKFDIAWSRSIARKADAHASFLKRQEALSVQ